jgi:hypothetical protein
LCSDFEDWVGDVVDPLRLLLSGCAAVLLAGSLGDFSDEFVDPLFRGGEMGQVGVNAPVALPGLMKNLDSNSNASNLPSKIQSTACASKTGVVFFSFLQKCWGGLTHR